MKFTHIHFFNLIIFLLSATAMINGMDNLIDIEIQDLEGLKLRYLGNNSSFAKTQLSKIETRIHTLQKRKELFREEREREKSYYHRKEQRSRE